jgi:hypothetical protein
MSTMETPPSPDAPIQPGPPERRCPRCGSSLAADQEWCLSCGAAAGTEVVEAEGWRVPLYIGGGLAALALIGVVLAIVALASRNDEAPVAQAPTPSPVASAVPPAATPTPALTPIPSTTPDPNAAPTTTPDPAATSTPDPVDDANLDSGTGDTSDGLGDAGGTGDSGDTGNTTEGAGDTDAGSGSTTDTSSSYPDWSGTDGYTVIIESAKTLSGAEAAADKASADAPGILNSDSYSSLNGGYYVVFIGDYETKSEAEDALPDLRDKYPGAYVRQIKA